MASLRGYKQFNANPRPGELRHLITIGRTEYVKDEYGIGRPRDVVVCRAWAGLTDAGYNEIVMADADTLTDVMNFVIRYRADVKPNMWLEFDGERRKITQLGRYEMRRAYLGIKAERQMAV